MRLRLPGKEASDCVATNAERTGQRVTQPCKREFCPSRIPKQEPARAVISNDNASSSVEYPRLDSHLRSRKLNVCPVGFNQGLFHFLEFRRDLFLAPRGSQCSFGSLIDVLIYFSLYLVPQLT